MNAIDRLELCPTDRARLTADAHALLDLALRIQGPDALTCTRAHAARHEAGHAIQHLLEGDRVRSVAVFPRCDDWLGLTLAGRPWAVNRDTAPAADLARARILLAGPLAELLTSARPALGAGLDEIVLAHGIACTVAAKLEQPVEAVLLPLLREVVEALLRNAAALKELTRALLRHRKLKGFELRRLLRAVVDSDGHRAPRPLGTPRAGPSTLAPPRGVTPAAVPQRIQAAFACTQYANENHSHLI